MSNFQTDKIETDLIHGGQEPDPVTGARTVPVYNTTAFVFKDTEHAKNLFGLAEPGNIYTRIMNPTTDVFEQRMALLEDGVGSLATASGMSAITLTILNITQAGDNIVADSNLYGGTYNLFAHTLPRYGVNVKLIDTSKPEQVKEAIDENTKAVYSETITNPSLNVLDIETIADIAHEGGVPLIIDNTFATPHVVKPLKWGADIVIHSATKWIGGHGTTMGGIVIDGGRFDWTNGRFPGFTEPDDSYHGVVYSSLGAPAFILKLRVQLLRDIGAALAPQSAFNFLQGLETLHVRVERHNENALKVVDYLENHDQIEWVNHPGSKNHPSHDIANKYFKNGYGSMITFGIRGGLDAGRKLINNIELFSHVANCGDAKSLIIHPASTTHQQLSEEGLKKSGVTPELVRLSVGIENIDDILTALDNGIALATDSQPTLAGEEKAAIEWLLGSSYVRGADVRQTTIAVTSNGLYEQAGILQKAGYNTIAVQAQGGQALGQAAAKKLSDIEVEVDAVWTSGAASEDLIAAAKDKGVSILWAEESDNAKSDDLTVIQGKNLVSEAIKARK